MSYSEIVEIELLKFQLENMELDWVNLKRFKFSVSNIDCSLLKKNECKS